MDNSGGSGKAAYAAHRGLKRLGVHSRMLVQFKNSQDPDVSLIAPGLIRFLDKACGRSLDHLNLQYLFYPSSFLLFSRRWFREADIIQLYVTHGGYFCHSVLPLLGVLRPVVWRLDDMWPLTGGCIFSEDCLGWKEGCGQCPYLSQTSFPALKRDTTAFLWKIKKSLYKRSKLVLVAPSRWIAGIVSLSPLLGQFPIHIIPYDLDTDVFHPIPKPEAREKLGINPNNTIVSFGAQDVLDPRKGASYLVEALRYLVSRGDSKFTALIFGSRSRDIELPHNIEAKRFGPVQDDATLALIYSAADVFVMPSLAELLGLVALESMACGTPVVAFRVGGIPEHVRHMETGYLATYKDADDLAKGIQVILQNSELYKKMVLRCRKMIEEEYKLGLQAERYLELYTKLADARDGLGRGL